MPLLTSFLCVALGFVLSEAKVTLEPGAFLKLPDKNGALRFDAGAADKADYDYQEHFLYVVGHRADVLHVVNMTDPADPQLLTTKVFGMYGLPNFVKVCRNHRDGFLAVTLEASALEEKGHIHFYQLMDADNYLDPLHHVKDTVTAESYDPSAIGWDSACNHLLVASEGFPHELNGYFQDPPGDIEILRPDFGTTVSRVDVPINQQEAMDAELRYAFERCTSGSGSTHTSTFLENLQPNSVHVDKNDIAYIIFQDNNGIARLDLKSPQSVLQFYSLGVKDWSNMGFDGAYEDNGITMTSRKVKSLYQPRDMASFELGGKVYLVTADTGSIRKYEMNTCRFTDSSRASRWNKPFSDGMTPSEISTLQAEMAANDQLGRLQVSTLQQATDGWDNILQGYNYVTMFGGRGFSILDSTTMNRVFDSSDQFESYFVSDIATEDQKAMFNAELSSNHGISQSSGFDKRSAIMGPEPSAIATGSLGDTKVVVIANGVVGGLYIYSVQPGLNVTFESYSRRGQAELSWNDAYYQQDTDSVGEPRITDLLFIDDQGTKTVVAVSQAAGALSFYSVVNN